MTNGEIGVEDIRTAYCDSCGYDYGIGVDEDDNVIIFCECEIHGPVAFVEGLESQLPLPSSDPEKVNKKSFDRDDQDGRGFQ